MDETQVAALRAEFQPEEVGKLPRVTCKQCSDNKQDRHCAKHAMVRCAECGQWITSAHMHLDYVGHAAATNRLLNVDPEWTWAPVAHDERGLPRLDEHGGLWISLTIGGVTRLGYGDAGTKKGPNAVKEAIGDAIRNAAMRFGVALYLWTKNELAADVAVEESPPAKVAAAAKPASPVPTPAGAGGDEHRRAVEAKTTLDLKDPDRRVISQAQRRKLFALAKDYNLLDDEVRGVVERVTGSRSTSEVERWKFAALLEAIELEGRGAEA